MSSIVIQGDTSGSITVEAPSVAGTHTLTLPKATGNIATDATVGLGMKNRIINGNMVIDQRNAGASITPADGDYTVDRWKWQVTQSSKLTSQRSTTAPSGFTNSLLSTSSSAYSIISTDRFVIRYNIEGYNIADLAWGTADAKTVTLSFWVRSSLTGTFGGSIYNASGSHSYPFTYTISSADTWEQKSVTITGATAGTWNTDNSIGLTLAIGLGVGSTYSTTAGAWAAGYYPGATGATSVVGTSGATLYLTGVQLEQSENATPFENRMYGTELALCQRYYQKSFAYGQAPANGIYTYGSTFTCHTTSSGRGAWIHFPVQMRATPSVTIYGTTGTLDIFNSGWVNWTNSAPVPRETGMYIDSDTGITVTVGYSYLSRGDWTASAEL